METISPFTVFNKIEIKDLRSYTIKSYLKDYHTILPALVGIILMYKRLGNVFSSPDIFIFFDFIFFLGLLLLINTVAQIISISKKYSRLPHISEGSEIHFDDTSFSTKAKERSCINNWEVLMGYSETSDFLILYYDELNAIYLQKKAFTTHQLNFIRSKAGVCLNEQQQGKIHKN